MSEAGTEQQDGELFGTGTVVARTGLTAARIRMWEKRYGAVAAQRTETNRRLYTRDDLERLSLLRRLTDSGHAIGRVATHSLERLRSLCEEESHFDSAARVRESGSGSVLVVSASGDALLGDQRGVEFEWSCPFSSLEEALDSPAVPGADVLLVETDTLFEETVDAAKRLALRCGAGRTVIAYRFATRELEDAVPTSDNSIVLLHGKRDPGRLRRECVFQLESLAGGMGLAEGMSIPRRLYDSSQLGQLAKIASAVECECPRHIAELLKELVAFEAYSEACEDRNNEDALVHAFLHRTTAQARRTMEDALQHLLQSEGIIL